VSFFMEEGVVRAVDGLSFDVFPGQVLGIVGESGCGKSVAMRAVLQLVEPPGRIVSGQIVFRPGADRIVDIASLAPRDPAMRAIRGAEIALIPQEPMAAFSPVHSVGDQIVEAIQLHWRQWRADGPPLKRAEARHITADLFRDVGISMPEQRLDAYSWQLSGGLRQRAMIAMALSCKPRLLIADEPTTAIDVTTQAQVLNLMRELQRKYQTAVIFITHDLGVIAQIARDVVVMYLGRVMEQGPVDAIFHEAKHPYTRALLRSIPGLQATPRVPATPSCTCLRQGRRGPATFSAPRVQPGGSHALDGASGVGAFARSHARAAQFSRRASACAGSVGWSGGVGLYRRLHYRREA
jgi:peptide/nickel transport system ATP-binding protein